MFKKVPLFLCVVFYVGQLASCAAGQSVELAKDYYQHSLNDRAKDILITVVHGSNTTPANKAKALYLLGQISFDEGHIKVALLDWQSLVNEYPQTIEAKEIGARLAISESSVKAVLQQLFEKTGVRTRSQLVRIALEKHSDEWLTNPT